MIAVLGSFDGFHLGHQKLFSSAAEMASELRDSWGVVTFSPHPQSVLGEGPFQVLFTEYEKDIIAKCLAVPEIIRIPFTRTCSELDPEAFFSLLERSLFLRGFVVGDDFRFGKDRKGDARLLERLAMARGWEVKIIPPLSINGKRVSSTSIRERIFAGDPEGAEKELGYPFFVAGKVGQGDGRGRDLGFPTLNLQIPRGKITPDIGVYAGSAIFRGTIYPAAINIGRNPTFPGKRETRWEAHIPGFNGNLYDEIVLLLVFRKLRREIPFGSNAALIEQMEIDVKESLQVWEQKKVSGEFFQYIDPAEYSGPLSEFPVGTQDPL